MHESKFFKNKSSHRRTSHRLARLVLASTLERPPSRRRASQRNTRGVVHGQSRVESRTTPRTVVDAVAVATARHR